MTTKEDRKKRIHQAIKGKTCLELVSISATLITFTATVYGSILLLFFSIKHNVKFIDLISPGILISAGTLAITMLSFISTLMVAISYINKESSQNNFLFLIYLPPYRAIYKHRKTTMALFNCFICLWPFILIKTSAVNITLAYLILLTSITLALSTIAATSIFTRKTIRTPTIKFRVGSVKRSTLFGRVFFFIVTPVLEVIVIISLILCLSALFKHELILISDNTFAFTVAASHFLLKLPSLSTSKRKRNLTNQLIAVVIIAETIMLLSFTFSQNLAQAVSNRIGITLDNKCFIRKEVLKNGIPRIYINEKQSNDEIVKLNLVTNINNIYYFSSESGNETDRKANIRIKGVNLTELDCPRREE
ncbi:hypothetical protein SME36J_46490 [Serratia marcescens]|nr:hypothetical protein SME36J_46490 [Serratia marcescens]